MKKIQTEDITELVAACAASLAPSAPILCRKDSFSLHDSMAALQIMDTKMDCCEVPAETYITTAAASKTIFPRPPPTGLTADPFTNLPWDDLTDKDAAYIGLQTLICFQAFLSGCSVGESSAICLYCNRNVMDEMRAQLFHNDTLERLVSGDVQQEQLLQENPNSFPKLIVYVFARALLQATEDSKAIIVNADIYEEEDFSPNSHDSPFFTVNEPEMMLPIMTLALQLAKKREIDDGGAASHYKVISLVLGVYFAFLSWAKTLEHHQTDLRDVQKIVRLTRQRLEQLVESAKPLEADDDGQWAVMVSRTFDSYLNRPLVGNAPVRKPNFKTASEACHALGKIACEMDWALCDLMANGSTLAKVEHILDRIQQSTVSIYTRSLVVTSLFFDEQLLGQHDLKTLTVGYMRQWTHVPDDFIHTANSQAFLGRLAKPIYDTLKLKLLNQCRQRAYIEAVSIPDWLALQSEAHMVDIHYRRETEMECTEPPFFSQFVVAVILRLMDRYLSSGLELGLFWGLPDIALVFWYRDYLLSALLNNLLAMRRTKMQMLFQRQQDHKQQQQQPSPPKQTGRGIGKKKTAKAKVKLLAAASQAAKPGLEERETDFEVILLTLRRDLCRGMKRFIALLQQVGVLKPFTYEFTSARRVFEERFELFQCIQQPPALTYDDYLAGSDSSQIPVCDLLRTTSDCFHACKTSVAQLLVDLSSMDSSCPPCQESELRWLQKVCVGNSIYLVKLQSIIRTKSESSTSVSFDFDGPNQFCIVKLDENTATIK